MDSTRLGVTGLVATETHHRTLFDDMKLYNPKNDYKLNTISKTIRLICFRVLSPWVCRVLICCLVTVAPVSTTVGAPVFGDVMTVRQPDGSKLKVRIWGDEFYGVTETPDGYTILRDPKTFFSAMRSGPPTGISCSQRACGLDGPRRPLWGSLLIFGFARKLQMRRPWRLAPSSNAMAYDCAVVGRALWCRRWEPWLVSCCWWSFLRSPTRFNRARFETTAIRSTIRTMETTVLSAMISSTCPTEI